MQTMLLERCGPVNAEHPTPLTPAKLSRPEPKRGEILIKVRACGVCHTELDEIEGRLTPAFFPIIPGHQVVGQVELCGEGATDFKPGERVGVGWIASSCGECDYCRSERENLCPNFRATGKDVDGGYAEYMVANEKFVFRLPEGLSDRETAPLFCAGSIGYRALRLSGHQSGDRLGLTGFGASNHLVLKTALALDPTAEIFVWARNQEEREFALSLGAAWAGTQGVSPPVQLDAVIDTTPVWKPPLLALKHLKPGGRLIINAIRKENHDRDSFLDVDYEEQFWQEKSIQSVANITRKDIEEFLAIAARHKLSPAHHSYPLMDANRALLEIKQSRRRGAKVLVME